MGVNYSIRINEVGNKDSNIKAFATITFGQSLAVRNVAIVQKKDSEELFVSMPSKRTNEVTEKGEPIFRDIANPITAEFYNELTSNILKTYENRKRLGGREATFGDDKESKRIPYNVKVSPISREDSSLCGMGRIFIDDSFVINGVRLIDGKNGRFISLPDYRTERFKDDKPVYRELVFPVTKEFREELYGNIEKAYNEAKKNEISMGNNKKKHNMEKNGKPEIERNKQDELEKTIESTKKR